MCVQARASARTRTPSTRFDPEAAGAQHKHTDRSKSQHDAARDASSQCPVCRRSVQWSELVLHHTHSMDGQSRPSASAEQRKFANWVPPIPPPGSVPPPGLQAEREAASVRHTQCMAARGMLWVCQNCNTRALPHLEPEVTGGFGQTVLLMHYRGQKLELLTKPYHPTLDGDEDTHFPHKQIHFANSAKFPHAFQSGVAPEKEDMAAYELVIDISTEQGQTFYRMPKEATRRELGPPAKMMQGLDQSECTHFSSTHIELAVRDKRGLAQYRKITEVSDESFGGEEFTERSPPDASCSVEIKSIKDFAPAPASRPSLSKEACTYYRSAPDIFAHFKFYSVVLASGEVKVVSDREIVGSGYALGRPCGVFSECRVLAGKLVDFLYVNQTKAPYFYETCGYCGTAHTSVANRRQHEFYCRTPPTHVEQRRRNSAAKAAGFKAGVHCDRGLGGAMRLQHVYTQSKPNEGGTKRPGPVPLDEARFVTEYLKLAAVSPAAPSCIRLAAAQQGVAQLIAAAQSVAGLAAGPSVPGANQVQWLAEQEEQAEACPTNPRAGGEGSSSGASPVPTAQRDGGTKRTSSGEVGMARARPVARRKRDPGPAVAIATALATPGVGGAARRQAKGLGQSKAEALKTLKAAHVGDCFSMEFLDLEFYQTWTAGILEQIEMPSTWTRGTSCWRLLNQTGDAMLEPMIAFDGGPGSVSQNFLDDDYCYRVGPSGA